MVALLSRRAPELDRSAGVQIANDWLGLVCHWADSWVDVTFATGRNPEGLVKRPSDEGHDTLLRQSG